MGKHEAFNDRFEFYLVFFLLLFVAKPPILKSNHYSYAKIKFLQRYIPIRRQSVLLFVNIKAALCFYKQYCICVPFKKSLKY